MDIGKIFRDAVGYIPVVRVIVDIVTCIVRISSGAVNEVEKKVDEIEAIHRWLKDNSVNTFSEYYEKVYDKGKSDEI